LKLKGIVTIAIILIVIGIGLVFSTSEISEPGLQDEAQVSDEVIIQSNINEIDSAQSSDEVKIDEDSPDYYIDEDGNKHYTIKAEDVASGSEP